MSRRVGVGHVQGITGAVVVIISVTATKYDGYVRSTVVGAIGTKYDGYVKCEVIYNFVGTKYDGYVESSVSI